MRKIICLMTTIVLISILTACGASEEVTPDVTTQPASNQVLIKASNFKFDAAEYKVKKGEPVTITFENEQGLHGIGIKDLDVSLDQSNKSVTITPDETGSYDIVCTIMCGAGHAEMKSVLIVE